MLKRSIVYYGKLVDQSYAYAAECNKQYEICPYVL